ncbi:hypothetical protein ETB97_003298 [Aspergillus alliaceus]|uniref:Uncharacterized protein n=1 Tax=Petromyces alliaceus TaxID=209559 RepID=A0A8H6E4G7_PETAA|nr:hypothetical protein ETB97_003298 [Aspergillus burnettii]
MQHIDATPVHLAIRALLRDTSLDLTASGVQDDKMVKRHKIPQNSFFSSIESRHTSEAPFWVVALGLAMFITRGTSADREGTEEIMADEHGWPDGSKPVVEYKSLFKVPSRAGPLQQAVSRSIGRLLYV